VPSTCLAIIAASTASTRALACSGSSSQISQLDLGWKLVEAP